MESEATPLEKAYANQRTSKRCEANLASCAWSGGAIRASEFAKEFLTQDASKSVTPNSEKCDPSGCKDDHKPQGQ